MQLWGDRTSVSAVVVDVVDAQLKVFRGGIGSAMVHAQPNVSVCRRADSQGLQDGGLLDRRLLGDDVEKPCG